MSTTIDPSFKEEIIVSLMMLSIEERLALVNEANRRAFTPVAIPNCIRVEAHMDLEGVTPLELAARFRSCGKFPTPAEALTYARRFMLSTEGGKGVVVLYDGPNPFWNQALEKELDLLYRIKGITIIETEYADANAKKTEPKLFYHYCGGPVAG